MPNFVGYSSEIYSIETADIACLEDYKGKKIKTTNDITVLISPDGDKLVSGRELVEQALKEKKDYINIQFAFKTKYNPFKFYITLVKKLRVKYRFFSSNIYHMNPQTIRDLDIERAFRTQDNKNPNIITTERYTQLEANILKNGYDDNFPMDVRLCRSFGVQDTLNQGHHRVSLLIKNNINRAAFEFSAVGYINIPLLSTVLKYIAKAKLKQKYKANY